jgi:hypothetical protein
MNNEDEDERIKWDFIINGLQPLSFDNLERLYDLVTLAEIFDIPDERFDIFLEGCRGDAHFRNVINMVRGMLRRVSRYEMREILLENLR